MRNQQYERFREVLHISISMVRVDSTKKRLCLNQELRWYNDGMFFNQRGVSAYAAVAAAATGTASLGFIPP